jgi:hypothetical protein
MTTYAGYMIDISNPEGWDFTGTAVIPPDEHHLPRCTAFYAGGNTPHVWTKEQIARSSNAFRLPIWVYDPLLITTDDAKKQAAAYAAVLRDVGVPGGSLCALDMETYVNGPFSQAFHEQVKDEGYQYVVYESESIAGNFVGDIGRWYAEWDGNPEITEPGAWAKQYANAPNGHPFDISSVRSFDNLWNIKETEKPPAPAPVIETPAPDPVVVNPAPARVTGATINLLYSDGVTQTLTASAPGAFKGMFEPNDPPADNPV